MAVRENIFVGTGNSVREEAAWLAGLLDLEPIPGEDPSGDDVGLRGRALTAEGFLGFRVYPNANVVPDPEPDDVQAIDGYPIQIDVWYGAGDPEIQKREARAVFDRMIAARPDVPLLLCHDLTFLIASYVPGSGVHEFDPATTMDAPDLERWREWVSV